MKDNAYTVLSGVYDSLNEGIDYLSWANFAEDCFSAYGLAKTEDIIELGCGTGNMTLELLRRGYRVTGVDLSPDMLSEAQRKAAEAGYFPLFLCQDMRDFSVYGGQRSKEKKWDAVTCCLDSINYLTESGDLARAFMRVHDHLKDGGLFLFDVNTPYKFEHIYGQNDYILEGDGVLCAWQNSYNKKSRICRFDLTLFLRDEDGRYARYDETHRERCYSLSFIEKTLRQCGFEPCLVCADFEKNPVLPDSERAYIVAVAHSHS